MRTNTVVKSVPRYTHEGARATKANPLQELRRRVLTCMLFEDTFYEKGSGIAAEIAELVKHNRPYDVAQLAIEARNKMYLRHTPLYLLKALASVKDGGPYVRATLPAVIQRADELAEFLAIYWKEGRVPLSAGVKQGLAESFQKFDEYNLAKYNRDSAIKLRDVMFLVHPKPLDKKQGRLWKKLVDGKLKVPDTWEVALSGGADKKETFERLLREGNLGGLATLRNLRNMQQAGVDEGLIRERLEQGIAKALPFRFITAARYAPTLEDSLEIAMLASLNRTDNLVHLPGTTGLLVDVSGSMEDRLSSKSETTRMDAAEGLAILLREVGERVKIATFSNDFVEVPPRRGFALRDAIKMSQPHMGTYTNKARDRAAITWGHTLDRMIIITDEQSHDRLSAPFVEPSYIINVAPYRNGISYNNGWHHIDGWSERVVDYIAAFEQEV